MIRAIRKGITEEDVKSKYSDPPLKPHSRSILNVHVLHRSRGTGFFYKIRCASSEDSGQPAYQHILGRTSAARLTIA